MNLHVTDVKIQNRNKKRFNIFLDGEYSFSCSDEIIYRFGISKGKEIDMDKIKECIDDDNYIKAKDAALNMLERTYKSEKEIKDSLFKKKYDDSTIKRTIMFLKEYNFLNDESYTDMYIKEKIKHDSKRKIRYSLLKKGIDKEIIDSKINDIHDEDEFESAMKLADSKYNILKKETADKRELFRKLSAYLVRKGYSYEVVNKIVRQLLR